MHRALVFLAAAFAAGIIANNLIRLTPGYLIVLLAFFLAWQLYRWYRSGTAPTAPFLLLAALVGALGHSFAYFPAVHSIAHWADTGPVLLSGTVVDRSASATGQPFILVRSERVSAGGFEREASGLVRVSLPDAAAIYPGELVSLSGQIERPAAAANPGEFDYRAYLLLHGVRAVMYLEDAGQVTAQGPAGPAPARLAYTWKNNLVRVQALTLPPDYAALLTGILYGVREDIPTAFADRLREAGVIHIITVSGLHVGFIICLAVLLGRLLRLSGRAAAVFNCAVVALYVFIVGAAPPVIRAGVMAGVGIAGGLLGRERDRYTPFAAAVLVVLGLNPLNLFDTGFQLSFVTTLTLIHLTPFVAGRLSFFPPRIRRFLSGVIVAQLGIAPLLLYYFFQLTPVALPANLLLLPLAGAAVGLGFAAGFAGLAWIGAAAGLNAVNLVILKLIILIAELCSQLPYANLYLTPPSPAGLAVYYCLLFTLPYWRMAARTAQDRLYRPCGQTGKAGIAVCLSLAAILAWVPLPNNRTQVTFLAVGQGSAAFIRTGRTSGILIDGGNRVDEADWQVDLGERVVEPFLRRQGISRLDIIYTHGHDDHIGGLVTVLDRFRVGTLYGPPAAGDSLLYLRLHDLAKSKGVPFRVLQAGDTLTLQNGAVISVLRPEGAESTTNLNETSLVLKLRAGELTVLFTGDSGPVALRRLLAAETDLSADILVVPHHGSRTAYAPELYRAVAPQYAVIPVGRNYFGHPHAQVIDSLQAMGIGVCRTDHTGAIKVIQPGETLRLTPFFPDSVTYSTDQLNLFEY